MAGREALPAAGSEDTLLVVDLFGSVYRFFKAPGQAKWAARQFAGLLERALRTRSFARAAVAVDNPWPTWRHEAAPEEWKARRTPMPAAEKAALLEQVRHAEELLDDAFGVRHYTARGYDGDDVAATLAEAGLRAGLSVVLLAHDKDFAQLVEDLPGRRCVVWDGREAVLDHDGVKEKFGVWPEQMVDYQALVGDGVDGVPGVRGVGKEGAQAILGRFRTLEAALTSAESDTAVDGNFWVPNGRYYAAMRRGRADALRCRELVTLRRDVPLQLSADLSELAVPPLW